MKKTRVFNGNQYVDSFVCDGRKYTKFQVFKFKLIRKTVKFLKVAGVILLTALITLLIKFVYFPQATIYEVKEIDTLSPKIQLLKDDVLKQLKTCESGSKTENDGLIIFDSNKVASIGLYQFQVKSVIYYYKTLYQKDITGKQAIEIALSEKESKALATDIIFKDSKGISNWYNCDIKNNLSAQINFIKKL